MGDRRTLGGGIYLTLSSLVFIISSYLVNIWLGRTLGPVDYGVYGIIISLMTAVNIIQTSGLPQSTSRLIASGKAEADAVLSASLRIQIVSTLVLSTLFILAARPLALLLHDPSLIPYIRATSLILPFYSIFALYTGYYNGLHDFRRQAFINIVYSLAKLLSVVGLVYVFHLYGAIAGFVLAPLIALLFGFHWPHEHADTSSLYKPIILFSLPLIGFAILSTLQISIDLFFVKSLIPSSDSAGLYTASQNVARIPFYALGAFALMLFPTVSRSITTELASETSLKIRETLRYLLLLLIPGTVLIASTSRELLGLLYSSAYIPSSASLSILVVGLASLTIFGLLANVINGAGRPGVSMSIAGVGVIVTIISAYILVPRLALTGAALATTLGGVASLLMSLYVVNTRFTKYIDWSSVLKITLASAVMYLGERFLDFSGGLLLMEYILLGFVYIGVLFIFREIRSSDLLSLRGLIPKNIPFFTNNE